MKHTGPTRAITLSLLFLAASAPFAARAVVIDESERVTLPGTVHPSLAGAATLGRAPTGMPMEAMLLVLRRSPEVQASLEQLLAAQQDPQSAAYHHWLTPAEFGEAFGPPQENVDAVLSWLQGHGFRVDQVAASRMTVTFSGVREQVESAFQTTIDQFEVDGATRYANSTDVSIPRALSSVIHGVVSLNNIPSRHALGLRAVGPSAAFSVPGLNWVDGSHGIAPGDFATIYNLSPLYAAGIDGTGATIAIVGRSDFNLSDIATFRSKCGLPALLPNQLTVTVNGTDPGILSAPGEEVEADLDVTWSSAVAKGASVVFVVSASTATSGDLLSAQYIVENNVAPIMSSSFGACELTLAVGGWDAFLNNLWSQAASQGISVFVSAGDSGPAACQAASATAGTGAAVSGYASTPYNVAVGGTEFNEGSGTYWNASNSPSLSSALSYIPEGPWNESGSVSGGSGLWAGGGGASTLYTKPSWQTAPGVPSDGMRDLPDVSLSSAEHDAYFLEMGGQEYEVWGTSVASPAFAGLMALVVQANGGSPQGNPNPTLYRLGAWQYGGAGPAIFHDVTSGNTNVPGVSSCCSATAGYDMATGLGSVDAYQLVTRWSSSVLATITAPASDLSVASGTSVSFTGSGNDSNANAVLSYKWVFGDGATATGASATHAFVNATNTRVTYAATLTVSDDSGNSASAVRNVTVLPVFALSVSESGAGTGSVTSNPPGISCTPTCQGTFASGSQVALTATAAPGSVFAGWSGAGCSGTGGCTVTMSQAQAVTATFLPTYVLTVATSGGGLGTVAGGGLTCTAGSATGCTTTETAGTVVTLTANPAASSIFAGWSGGGCSGTGTCVVTMSQAQTVVAIFLADYSLTVTAAGTGSGQVTGGGLACSVGSTAGCLANEVSGTVVILTASAAPGSTFTGWSGGGCSGTGSCTVVASQAESVTATFAVAYTLTVSTSGDGAGSVAGGGVTCSSGSSDGCAASEPSGTVVTLTATASGNSTFAGWQGAGCSGTGSCTVTMGQAQSVTATFLADYLLTVATSGNGSGGVSGSGVACSSGSSGGCAVSEVSGTTLTLTASPASGSTFTGWSGATCSGTSPCTVTMSESQTVLAGFALNAPGGCQTGGGSGLGVLALAFARAIRRRRRH